MEAINHRLHESWLCQLVREYDDICYQYGIRLDPPILTISMNKRQLGSWSAADRNITLSHFLIAHHPWNLTLQVLKHEMAHQICSEIHCQKDAGHGPLFRESCARIGLDAPFQRASADLQEGMVTLPAASETTEQGRQIIEKVRKLMALGSSDNEHEAALAVQRAGELLSRYRLDLDALAEEEGLVHRTINTGKQTLPVHRKAICSLLETCFSVRVICASLYDPLTEVSLKTIELMGREEAVAIAEHCYHFLENRLQTLWEKNRRGFSGNSRIAKKSYYLGLLAGFRQTLEQSRNHSAPQDDQPSPAASLPVLREQQRLDDFVAFRFPRLRRMRRQGTTMYRDAYQEAVTTGRKITLNRPVNGGKEEDIRLLS
jgi:hypothetical protein